MTTTTTTEIETATAATATVKPAKKAKAAKAKAKAEPKVEAPANPERKGATTGDAFRLLDAARGTLADVIAALEGMPMHVRAGAVKKALTRTGHKETLALLREALAGVVTGGRAPGSARGPKGEYKVHRHTKASDRKLVSLPIPADFPVEIGGAVVVEQTVDADGNPCLILRPAPVAA